MATNSIIADLRSDTVTKPTAAMHAHMMSASVGDDVFGEDPSIHELEHYAAALFGKEAALFCPSGTMTNQIAIKLHTQPGDELLCDANAHIYNYEGGGISFNSGVQAKLLNGQEGRLSVEMIEANINADFDWLTRTSLVALENTVNRAGGSYYSLDQIRPIAALCREKGLALHLDGARIFNALTVTGESPSAAGEQFDTISICLSKGLGAPVGSLLIGTNAHIKKARKIRKVFGGGMRQAGFLAAAGLYALKNHITRLSDDHQRAKELGKVLTEMPYVKTVLPVYTNIVIFHLQPELINGATFENLMKERGVKISAFGKDTIRMVTHLDFTSDHLEHTIKSIQAVNKF
jgi:threonine aldolase